jgi:hypothetical protein
MGGMNLERYRHDRNIKMSRMQLVVLVHGARRDGCTVRPAPGRANSRVRPAAAARVQLRACPVPPPVGSHAWRGSPACCALRLRCGVIRLAAPRITGTTNPGSCACKPMSGRQPGLWLDRTTTCALARVLFTIGARTQRLGLFYGGFVVGDNFMAGLEGCDVAGVRDARVADR